MRKDQQEGLRDEWDEIRKLSCFILQMGLRVCGHVFQGFCGYPIAQGI